MTSKNRALFLLLGLACAFTAISVRLIDIQVYKHDYYWNIAEQKHLHFEAVPQRRGPILDANGDVLAQTLTVWDVRLDGGLINLRPDKDLAQIADVLRVPELDLEKVFKRTNRDILLATDQNEAVATQLAALKLRALKLIPHDKRDYPNNALAAQVIGYMDQQNHGASGVEKEMDDFLAGIPGKKWMEMNARRVIVPGYQSHQNIPPVDGYNINLTLNIPIQHVVEEELDQIVQKYQPENAYIIVMQPQTGEIMAIGSRPSFDLTDRSSYKPELLKNGCLNDTVEPGSIFKIITIAAALNEGFVKLTTPVFCENGVFNYAGKELHDDESNGWLSVREVLSKSSNIGCAKIALDYLHEERLYNYARNFGFGQRTGLFSNQGESPGKLRPLAQWSGLSITRIPMGQEVAATPLQMVTAMSAIANGGRLMRPHLIRSITNNVGQTIKAFPPQVVRQVVSPETASYVTEALKAVMTEGTGRKIPMKNYIIAGKTGTAQVFENGAYSHTKHVSSFLGFLPADDPQLCMLVMIKAPQTSHNKDYGAEVSLPAFIDVGCQAAEILNIPHDLPDQPVPLSLAAPSPTGSANNFNQLELSTGGRNHATH